MPPEEDAQPGPDHQNEDRVSGLGDFDSIIEITHIKEEIEEHLPDGTIRRRTYTNRSVLLRKRPGRLIFVLQFVRPITVPLIVFLALIIIGLVAVGVGGVWNDAKEFIPDLMK